MKFIVERDTLRDALSVVIGRTKGHSTIPILSHILIEGQGQTIKLIGNDLDSCSEVTIPAEVSEQGRFAIPGDYFAKLVSGFSDGAQVTVTADTKAARVKAGRSSYSLPLLPPEDFPESMVPRDPVAFTLTAKQIARLFKLPANAISDEQGRYYLCGIFLHLMDKRLAACATNGHILLRAYVDCSTPDFAGVIVPDKSCAEIVRVVGSSPDASVAIGSNALSIEAGSRRFVTKLVDGTFPDYVRVIPQATAPVMAVTSAEFDQALARLAAACDRETTAATKLSWEGDAQTISASLRSNIGSGDEQIECDCPGREPGEVGANIDYLRSVVESLGGSRVRLFIDDPGSPIRLENPDDPDVVGVVMPCRV
jgi:DNA polymerase III subunit beta